MKRLQVRSGGNNKDGLDHNVFLFLLFLGGCTVASAEVEDAVKDTEHLRDIFRGSVSAKAEWHVMKSPERFLSAINSC